MPGKRPVSLNLVRGLISYPCVVIDHYGTQLGPCLCIPKAQHMLLAAALEMSLFTPQIPRHLADIEPLSRLAVVDLDSVVPTYVQPVCLLSPRDLIRGSHLKTEPRRR